MKERPRPKVAIIIVNYNSYKKFDIIRECIASVMKLKYDPLEVLIVDNGSTDGSDILIKQLIEEHRKSNNVNIRFIKLTKNYGFAAANVIAYRLRRSDVKYVALINNDCAPEPHSLEKMISILEKFPGVAALQGIILRWDGERISSFGLIVTDDGRCYPIGAGLRYTLIRNFLRPIPVTATDGAYSVYRVDALEKCGGLFLPYFFMWGDDYEVGIRLWRCGYVVLAVPIIAGKHYEGATVASIREHDDTYRYWYSLSRYTVLAFLYSHRNAFKAYIRAILGILESLLNRDKIKVRAIIDSIRWMFSLVQKVKEFVKLNNGTCYEPRISLNIMHELTYKLKSKFYSKRKSGLVYDLVVSMILGLKLSKLNSIIHRLNEKLKCITF